MGSITMMGAGRDVVGTSVDEPEIADNVIVGVTTGWRVGTRVTLVRRLPWPTVASTVTMGGVGVIAMAVGRGVPTAVGWDSAVDGSDGAVVCNMAKPIGRGFVSVAR